MKTLPQYALILIGSLLLLACSVEQKPASETVMVPEQTELPAGSRVAPTQVIDTPAARLVKPPLSTAQRFSGALESHNRIRAKHRLSPLKWSDKLANYSQQWANHLGSGSRCIMRHRGGEPPYGENLYWSSAVVWSDGKRDINRVTIRDVVKVWTDEERWYDYNRNSCQPGQRCGHYTQVVWRNTTEVGCAVKVCNDKSQTWVCSYNPPGNFTGVRPY